MMFKFMLAYADEPRATKRQNPIGDIEYGMFDRYNFLERDAAGELYWNDDFLFSVDTTNNNAQNREALWNSTKEAYQSGAFRRPCQYRYKDIVLGDTGKIPLSKRRKHQAEFERTERTTGGAVK